jgi:hypothetical protein
MAQQTRTSRQAAASKAAATRKRTAAKRSATRTRSAARQTAGSTRTASRGAKSTARHASRTATGRIDAVLAQMQAFARHAERAVLVPVGAALEARDSLGDTLRVVTKRRDAKARLRRFERRGEQALRRNRRAATRRAKAARRGVETLIPNAGG